LLRHFLAEPNVLFDFVVEVGHVVGSVPHPKLDETHRATLAVPQVGISESAEDVVTRLVRSRELVDISQLFESFVQVATDDVRLRQRLARGRPVLT